MNPLPAGLTFDPSVTKSASPTTLDQSLAVASLGWVGVVTIVSAAFQAFLAVASLGWVGVVTIVSAAFLVILG